MFILPIVGEHQYTLAATGIKIGSYIFDSREKARKVMYEIIDKNNLHVIKKYDDKHFKTYICNNGVRFYINRI